MESEEPSIHFNCFVHYPGFTEEGLEEQTVARGNGIQLSPKTQLSSLAASVLSEMFQKQEIDGKVIMKADNAKGECVRFARPYICIVTRTCTCCRVQRQTGLKILLMISVLILLICFH